MPFNPKKHFQWNIKLYTIKIEIANFEGVMIEGVIVEASDRTLDQWNSIINEDNH